MDEKMLTDDVFVADPVEERLMLGNEAVAQGAWEAGLRVVASYPGTPSTEITECVARFPEVDCQWAPNEKVATEVAFGAAMAGARAMTCMKHVGVNVAADPIFTAAYTGVNAGLVVVCADDPAMHSSQNEQDSRYYARAAHIPMLEPSDSRECHAFTRLAFTMSEELDTPVFLRLTTRVAHARSVVAIGERADVPLRPYQKDAMKYVMMPGMARKRHLKVEAREAFLAEAANRLPINVIKMRDTSIGIITSGVCYEYVRDAMPHASTLKLGMVYPLPMKLIREFSQKVDRLIVVEELEGLIEREVLAAGIPCEGKNLTGIQGELSVEKLRSVLLGAEMPKGEDASITARPPVLGPGCPHRGVVDVLNKLGMRVMGDIGCYSLDMVLNAVGYPKPLTVSGYKSAFFGTDPNYSNYVKTGHPEYAEKFGVDDFAAAFVRLEGGIILDFRIAWAMNINTPGDTIILGTKGGLRIPSTDCWNGSVGGPMTIYHEVAGEQVETVVPIIKEEANLFDRKIRTFLDAAKNGTAAPIPSEQIIYNQAILDGILKSAELGREVEIEIPEI